MTCPVWINDELIVLAAPDPYTAVHAIKAYCQLGNINWKWAIIVARNFPEEGQFLIKDSGELDIREVHNTVHPVWFH